MKYLQIYENFGELEYQEFHMFDYLNSPKFSNFQVISQSTFLEVEKVLKNISWPQFFNYQSKLELSKFFMLDWPIYLETFDDDIEKREDWREWVKEWRYILDKTSDKEEKIFDKKCLTFRCRVNGLKYKYNSSYHYVSIIKDDDDYYYVTIRLEGAKKHFKCDQEFGLENCLKIELKNKKGFERDLE
jgi:hypothetical protein